MLLFKRHGHGMAKPSYPNDHAQTGSTADPLDDLIEQPRQARSKARPEVETLRGKRRGGGGSIWLVAALASLLWVLAVAAFCWSRYGLPLEVGAASDIAATRISTNDWLLIAAAIIAPLLLIWTVAALLRRAVEMRNETRELATAAIRLAHAAKSIEDHRSNLALAGPGLAGEIDGETPRHFRREVERATHAISALHSQMRAIEEALSTQAAAIDDVAERAERRARDIATTLRTERTELEALTTRLDGGDMPGRQSGATAAGYAGAGLAAATVASGLAKADIVDMSLDGDATADGTSGLNEPPAESGWLPRLDGADHEMLPDENDTAHDPRVDPFNDLPGGAVADPETGQMELPGREALRDAVAENEKDSRPDFSQMRRNAIDWEKFVRASNFPESEDDSATLDALYDVLTDPEIASLLQSAEDTLASLADMDLYMEDFAPQLPSAVEWKSYLNAPRPSEGETSPALPMPGISAPREQQRIAAKRDGDKGFERLSEKFLDRYEHVLRRMLREETDERHLVDLADTRSGRAWLLLAQASNRITPSDAEV